MYVIDYNRCAWGVVGLTEYFVEYSKSYKIIC